MAEQPETAEPVADKKSAEQPVAAESGPAPTRRPGEPFEIAVLALQNTTLFPETVVPLAVGRPRSVAAVEAALATEEKLLACITVRADVTNASQDAGPDALYKVGTLTMIKRMERIGETMHIIAQGTDRVKVVELEAGGSLPACGGPDSSGSGNRRHGRSRGHQAKCSGDGAGGFGAAAGRAA